MPDLFAAPEESRRQRLRVLGWEPITYCGRACWRNHKGSVLLDEASAFEWLSCTEPKTEEPCPKNE